MKKSAEFIGLPIISISEGCEFGKVKELLINAAAGTISALVLELDEKKWCFGAELIPFESVLGIGDSALIIENSKDILPFAAREEFQKFFEADVRVNGTKVLTRNGKFQGKVNEFSVEVTGKIELCEMERPDGTIVNIPASRIVTFGKEILIINDESDEDKDTIVIQSQDVPKPALQQAAPAQPVQEKPVNDKIQPEPPAAPVMPKPVAAQPITPPAAPAAPKESMATPDDAAAKKTEGKPRDFLIGKKATRRIESDKGALIIEENGIVTEEVLQKATLSNKLIDLSMSVI